MLLWKVGDPPEDDMEAGHTCPAGENAACLNPAHLAWMTRWENERYKRFMEEDV